uniref:Pistil-specific extensin-like protein n=1 Tax=Kalanchoe fedtschenkoi TaxID=63787 RepID=A0A7N1A116_KALFE
MGSVSFAVFASSILLLSVAAHVALADLWGDEDDVIHVVGKVLCQDCSQGWNEWVKGSDPIKGSVVSVTCFDDRNRVIYYNSDTTDDSGVYDITMGNKYANGKKLNPRACSVRLVSSPNPVCNVLTNSGGGKDGVKLGRPSSVYRDVIKYNLRPFYYTTPMCEEPDTSEGEGDDDKDHSAKNY